MTDYDIKLNSGTELSALLSLGEFSEITKNKTLFISDSTTLTLNTNIHANSIFVGTDGTTLSNETGTLKLQSPYQITFPDVHPLTVDPRIIWATDGSREVDRGSGVKIDDLSGNGNYGTRGSGTYQTGPWHIAGLQLLYDMQTLVESGASVGKMKDLSGNARHGSFTSGCITVKGKFGQAQEYRINDDYGGLVNAFIESTDLDLSLPFSLSAWVYRKPQTDTIGRIIDKGTNYILAIKNDGALHFQFTDAGPTTRIATTAASTVPLNTWTHVIVKVVANTTNTDVTFYVNGAQVGSTQTLTNQPTLNNTLVRIGSHNGGELFQGILDDVSIFNTALTAKQIRILSETGYIDYGWYFDFDANGRIDVTNTQILNPKKLTILFWLKRFTDGSGEFSIVRKTPSAAPPISGFELLLTNSNKVKFTIANDATSKDLLRSTSSSGSVTSGSWKHVAVTYNGTSLRIYIDGVLDVERTYDTFLGIQENTSNLLFGNSGNDYILDEFYMFNEALTPSEIWAYKTLSESSVGKMIGLTVSESGNVITDTTTNPISFGAESNLYPTFTAENENPRYRYDMFVQGTGWTASHYLLRGHSVGFVLQSTTSGLNEDFMFNYIPEDILSINDSGVDPPITNIINRLGNVSRIKKIGYSPREVSFALRLSLEDSSGLSLYRRFEQLGSTTYKESDIFNIITDKNVLIGYQLTNIDISPIQSSRYKLVDISISFTKRVL